MEWLPKVLVKFGDKTFAKVWWFQSIPISVPQTIKHYLIDQTTYYYCVQDLFWIVTESSSVIWKQINLWISISEFYVIHAHVRSMVQMWWPKYLFVLHFRFCLFIEDICSFCLSDVSGLQICLLAGGNSIFHNTKW